jgi:hypothetical protein
MYRSGIVLGALLFFIGACSISRKPAYEFPAAMPGYVKSAYTEQCDKGKILYDINCGGCHNKMVKGKAVIPDFSAEELEVYRIRVTNAQHEDKLSETHVSPEELALILTFLTYKRKGV